MKTSIKNISDTKISLTITVDAEALSDATQVAAAKLARELKVPGFRKGKAPMSVAVKNIDPNMLQERLVDNAISKAVAEAFLENKIQALDRPMVEVKKFVPGEILEFTAEAEILPAIKLGNYKKLKAKVEKVVVTDKDIDEVIERIRQGFAEKKEATRAAKLGDEANIDFVGKKDGVAFDGGAAKGHELKLGSGQFIPGFEEGIVGRNIGDTFDLDLTFPADYGSAELKGAKVTFTTTLNSLKEPILPELNDEFAAKAGPFKTISELKADIKRELTSQKERESTEKLKDELVKQLVEISHAPAPEILVLDQMKSIEQDFTQNLMYQGLSIDQYLENKGFETKEKWLEAEVRDIAKRRVEASLVLAELSKIEKVVASTEELENQINIYKQQYGKNPKALEQLEQPEVRNDIANRLLTDKTVNILLALNSK